MDLQIRCWTLWEKIGSCNSFESGGPEDDEIEEERWRLQRLDQELAEEGLGFTIKANTKFDGQVDAGEVYRSWQ